MFCVCNDCKEADMKFLSESNPIQNYKKKIKRYNKKTSSFTKDKHDDGFHFFNFMHKNYWNHLKNIWKNK